MCSTPWRPEEVIRFSRTKVAESYESSCRYWELNPKVTSGQSLSHLCKPSVKSSVFHFVPFFSVLFPLSLPSFLFIALAVLELVL